MNVRHKIQTAALLGAALLLADTGSLIAATNKPPAAAAATKPAPAATTNAPGSTSTTTTNKPYASTFDSNGRDPFFPRSARLAPPTDAGTENQGSVVLALKGFSGSASRRFAVINDRTFAAGEENEVRTPNGRVRIRCVEIRADTVIVTIGSGEKIELRLPPTRF